MIPTTVLIPTSPIPSHPDTSIIEETIQSIRDRVQCEILVMCDGVRPEQGNMDDAYNEYLRRLIFYSEHWGIRPLIYPWLHQAGVTKATLPLVTTPTFLFVEHDTPLVGEIPFGRIIPMVESAAVNVLRFYFDVTIHPDHQHLMIGTGTIQHVTMTFTRQWSQRPFVANTEWFRQMMKRWFSNNSRCFIEDRVHGPSQNEPWGNWRIALYTPDGDIKRSTHTDGRAGLPKYDETQIW